MKYGVATIDRTDTGTVYLITDNRQYVFARVTETDGVYYVRNVFGNPMMAGSLRYGIAVKAVDEYKAWAATH